MAVVDVSDPARMVSVGAIALDGWPVWTALDGDHVYIVDYDHLFVAPRYCGDVASTLLAGYRVSPGHATATISWTLGSSGKVGEFRVAGSMGASEWEVPHQMVGLRQFRAVDLSPEIADGGEATFALYHREGDDAWALLATKTVFIDIPGLATQIYIAWPNPFNRGTTFAFTVPTSGHDSLAFYDLAGRRVAVLADRHFNSGTQELDRDAMEDTGLPISTGVYSLRLEAAGQMANRKVTIVK